MPSHRRLRACSLSTLLARTFVVPPMAARGAPSVLPTLDTSSRRSCTRESTCDRCHAGLEPPSMASRAQLATTVKCVPTHLRLGVAGRPCKR